MIHRQWNVVPLIACLLFTPLHAENLTVDCLIEPAQQVALGTPVTGVLDQVMVKRGARVAKGQVVATLMSSAEHAALLLAQYKASQSAQVEMVERKLAFAKQKFERRQSMSQEQLMPLQDRDDAEAEFRMAEAELLVAREGREVAQLEYKQQKALFDQRSIRSPLNGVVVEQSSYPGEVVEPGSNGKPVVRLAQLDQLRVQVILPKSRFGTVQPGQRVSVVPESPIRGQFSATVKSVDKLLDAASGTFVVYLDLPNPKLAIPAGARCRAGF